MEEKSRKDGWLTPKLKGALAIVGVLIVSYLIVQYRYITGPALWFFSFAPIAAILFIVWIVSQKVSPS